MERLNAKKEFKIGMAHVGYAYDFCVESKDRQLAEQVYRDMLQRCQQLSEAFGFSLDGKVPGVEFDELFGDEFPHLTLDR